MGDSKRRRDLELDTQKKIFIIPAQQHTKKRIYKSDINIKQKRENNYKTDICEKFSNFKNNDRNKKHKTRILKNTKIIKPKTKQKNIDNPGIKIFIQTKRRNNNTNIKKKKIEHGNETKKTK